MCELIGPLGLSQPTVSHHLKKLTTAGLLRREQRGVWAYYSIDREALARVAGLLDMEGAELMTTTADDLREQVRARYAQTALGGSQG